MASVSSSTSQGNSGAAKVCIACGQDCSNKPRSKDAQGRYTCKDCIDRVQAGIKSAKGPGSVVVKPAAALPADAAPKPAKKPTPKATDPGTEPDFMALFGNEPPKIGDPCEQCGDAMPPGGRICIRCGFDRESGKRMKTRVQASPKERESREPSKLANAAGTLAAGGAAWVLALIGATVGAGLGAGIWAGVALATNYEIGYVAILVGVISGAGAYFGARGDSGLLTGLLAVIASIVAIIAGKYIVVSQIVDQQVSQVARVIQVDDEQAVSSIADEVVEEYQSKKKPVNWPRGSDAVSASVEADYPKDVWADAKGRFDAKSPTEQESFKRQIEAQMRAGLTAASNEFKRNEGLAAMFSPLDILFGFFAIGAAFKIGASGFDVD